MYSFSIVCSFLSVWCLYSASSRVEFEKKGLSLWLSGRASLAKVLSACLFILSTLTFSLAMGPVICILTSVCLWMLIASSITLFTPFRRVSITHLGLLLVLSIGLEFLFSTLKH